MKGEMKGEMEGEDGGRGASVRCPIVRVLKRQTHLVHAIELLAILTRLKVLPSIFGRLLGLQVGLRESREGEIVRPSAPILQRLVLDSSSPGCSCTACRTESYRARDPRKGEW